MACLLPCFYLPVIIYDASRDDPAANRSHRFVMEPWWSGKKR